MFGVLAVHADFGALGQPTHTELATNPVYGFTRIAIEALAIVSVNVFVLISGWFGIKFRWSSLCKLLFQCFFFFFGIFFACKSLEVVDLSYARGIYKCLMLSPENAWFVKSYIGMFIFAPAVNIFMEHSSEKQARMVLISFYLFQTIYGWFSYGAPFIKEGYSAFSFIGLYLLARYVRIHRPAWANHSTNQNILIYAGITGITMVGLIMFTWFDKFTYFKLFWLYSSPLVIAASLFLLLSFSKLRFYNKAINTIAESCFAVYLFHFILFHQYMSPWIREIATAYHGLTMLVMISILLIVFYMAAILIDRIRLVVWNTISNHFIK